MRRPLYCNAIWIAASLLLLVMVTSAPAQNWNSFAQATCTGITLTPSFASGVTSYQLCLSNGATLNGVPINWIQAFYAVGGTQATTFTATDNSNSLGWGFDFKQNPNGEIAGWAGSGDASRLHTPTTPNTTVCGTFQYGTFTIPVGSSVIPGFHIGYGDTQSGFFKCPVTAVPELPTALLTFGISFISAIPLLRYKPRRS